MKRTLLSTALLLSGLASLNAQTTLFSENFNGGTAGQFTLNTSDMSSTTSGVNDWVVNNAYAGGSGTIICLGFPFSFTVANTAAQPGGITGSPNSHYMHIRSDAAAASGIQCASFVAADGFCTFAENNFTRMSSDISTVGYTTVSFNFWWICGGSANNYGEVYYSTNGGSTWTLVTSPVAQYFGQASTWTQQSISLPAFANQATLRFGFRFVNNTTTTATDPGMAIDDITIIGSGGGCTPTTSTTNHTSCGPYIWNSVSYTTSGTYTYLTTNAGGCDSTATLNLTVNSPTTSTTNHTSCGSYTWNGSTYATSGTYTYLTTNAAGCDSTATLNLTVNQNTSSSTTHSSCGAYTWNGTTYNSSGTYTYTTTNAAGCDSIATLNLTVTTIDVSVSQVGNTLNALFGGASYQWIDCNNGNQPISGATSQSFTATTSGSYAVEITLNACSSTSACITISTIGLEDVATQSFSVFPNPNTGQFYIVSDRPTENVSIRVMNVVGQVVYSSSNIVLNKMSIELPSESGLYLLELTHSNGKRETVRVVKN